MKKFSPFTTKKIDTERVLPVFELDPSQKEAVALALSGKSFVLNGPPGTGKSHTIAALLVNALYERKSVLFVAQKSCALDVVWAELHEAGLADYFLRYRKDQRAILETWKALLTRSRAEESDFKENKTCYEQEIRRANAFHAALHEGKPSLFADIEEYFSLPEENCVRVTERFFQPFRKENYDRAESLLFLYASLSQGVSLKNEPLACYGDFFVCKEELKDLGVEVIRPFLPCETLLTSFRKSFLKGYCRFRIEEELPSFSSFAQNSLLERLRFEKKEVVQSARDAVRERWEKKLLSYQRDRSFEKEERKLAALLYRKKFDTPVLSAFPRMRKLTPCLLASVEDAEAIDEDFDIVLFDESSQILRSDALPIAAKGDTVVIAGDEKQLPPTTFFSSAKGEEKENILEFALSEGLYRHSLSRHYRSKNQSLIAFSNRKFYGGELFAFPSVSLSSAVTLRELSGVYERKGRKINPKEARAVVDRAVEILRSPEDRGKTLGIVTLSLSQRDEVERELFTRIRREKISPERVASSGLFVKNLESVQGEERDVILLSLCFGKDEEGKLSLRFGPLNHDGGERRLNVALTRAKERTEVFSSLPESFFAAKSANEGVNALREFLLFVKGELPAAAQRPVSPLVNDLARRLKSLGYRVDVGVGNEKFCIDLAIRSGKTYKLGVLLDKKENTAEELLFFTEILKGSGWNVLCLYAVDYFRSPERETEKVLSVLQKIGVTPQKTREKGEKTS